MKLRTRKTAPPAPAADGNSKTRLVLGAAGLLLFILGVRRTFQPDAAPAETEVTPVEETPEPAEAAA